MALPWKVGESIESYLGYNEFPNVHMALSLGSIESEGITWLIHLIGSKCYITTIVPGGLIEGVSTFDDIPYQLEGMRKSPLKFGIHMDATALAPLKRAVIGWLERLCRRPILNEPEQKGLVAGDVLFTGDHTAVKKITKSDWSHAALYIGGGTVAEVVKSPRVRNGNGAQPIADSDVYLVKSDLILKSSNIAILRHPSWNLLSENKLGLGAQIGWSQKYSVPSAMRSFLHRFGFVGLNNNGIFCSQYVLSVYQRLGLEGLSRNEVNPYSITPGDLFFLLLDRGFYKVDL